MKSELSIDTGKTASLFVDLQEEHRQDPRYLVADFETIISNIRKLQSTARENNIPLIHSAYVVDPDCTPQPFHPRLSTGESAFSQKGNPGSEICHEVGPVGAETLLIKNTASAFGDGRLVDVLTNLGAQWLIITGVWTEACIDATVRDAVERGVRVILIKDACGSGSAAMHQTAILNLANRLYGGAVTDTAGALELMKGKTIDAWMVQGSVPIRFTYDNAANLYGEL